MLLAMPQPQQRAHVWATARMCVAVRRLRSQSLRGFRSPFCCLAPDPSQLRIDYFASQEVVKDDRPDQMSRPGRGVIH
jgi:hypothetical protein